MKPAKQLTPTENAFIDLLHGSAHRSGLEGVRTSDRTVLRVLAVLVFVIALAAALLLARGISSSSALPASAAGDAAAYRSHLDALRQQLLGARSGAQYEVAFSEAELLGHLDPTTADITLAFLNDAVVTHAAWSEGGVRYSLSAVAQPMVRDAVVAANVTSFEETAYRGTTYIGATRGGAAEIASGSFSLPSWVAARLAAFVNPLPPELGLVCSQVAVHGSELVIDAVKQQP